MLRCVGDENMPHLVLLHGFLGSKDDWEETLEFLLPNFYCILVDLPAHGAAKDIDVNNLDECAVIIQKQLDSNKIGKYHLCGYSLGGRIALHIAKLFPDKVLSLNLESTNFGLPKESRVKRIHDDKQIAHKLETLSAVDFLTAWYKQSVFIGLDTSALILKRTNAIHHNLAKFFLKTSLGTQNEIYLDCNYIFGTLDLKFSNIAHESVQKAKVINKTIKIYPIIGAGHNTHFAKAKEFSHALTEAILC